MKAVVLGAGRGKRLWRGEVPLGRYVSLGSIKLLVEFVEAEIVDSANHETINQKW